MKSQVYPEYGPLLLAAKKLGRPVKWTDERSESFLSDHHGRDHQRVAELALDKDSHFLAVRLQRLSARSSIRCWSPITARQVVQNWQIHR